MAHSAYKHFVRRAGGNHSITVVGAGGNGGQILTALAKLNHALVELTGYGIHVTCIDGDRVSSSNVGRQPFYSSDVGLYKAEVLIGRINSLYGTDWTAQAEMLTADMVLEPPWMFIGCVDTPSARRAIHAHATKKRYVYEGRKTAYWLDMGNKASIGQYILGEPLSQDSQSWPLRLPTVIDLWPDLLDPNLDPVDDGPSCSMADALMKQDLFVNTVLVSQAVNLIWQLMRQDYILFHGGFVNLSSGKASALGVNINEWKSLGYKAKRPMGKRAEDFKA